MKYYNLKPGVENNLQNPYEEAVSINYDLEKLQSITLEIARKIAKLEARLDNIDRICNFKEELPF